MRSLVNSAMVLTLLCLITVWHSPAFGQGGKGVSEMEQEVWNVEEAYWNYLKEGKFDEFEDLFHKDFWGWPLTSPIPIDRDTAIDSVKKGAESMKENSLAYALIKHRVNIVGNVAIVYYSYIFSAELPIDNVKISDAVQITHVWLKQPDGKWKIIGGNSRAMPASSGNLSLITYSSHQR